MACPQDLRRVLDLRDCPEVVLASEELGTVGGPVEQGAGVRRGITSSPEGRGTAGACLDVLTGGNAGVMGVLGRSEVVGRLEDLGECLMTSR